MKFAALTGAAMAALAAGAIATPSFAQDPCHRAEHNRGTTGAVVGGIAGALLGSSIDRHHTGGAVIGGVAGALAGNAIGRNSGKNSDRCEAYNGYYDSNGAYVPAYGYYAAPSAEYYSAPTSAYAPSGYYDSDGDWHSNYATTNGYYDSNGYWHSTNNTTANGYYDDDGYWHPYR